jgi:hypothetical protein
MPACLAVPGHCPNQLISPLRAERDNWCVCRDEHVLSFFVFVFENRHPIFTFSISTGREGEEKQQARPAVFSFSISQGRKRGKRNKLGLRVAQAPTDRTASGVMPCHAGTTVSSLSLCSDTTRGDQSKHRVQARGPRLRCGAGDFTLRVGWHDAWGPALLFTAALVLGGAEQGGWS